MCLRFVYKNANESELYYDSIDLTVIILTIQENFKII